MVLKIFQPSHISIPNGLGIVVEIGCHFCKEFEEFLSIKILKDKFQSIKFGNKSSKYLHLDVTTLWKGLSEIEIFPATTFTSYFIPTDIKENTRNIFQNLRCS